MHSWFSRHLNWTYVFSWVFLAVLALILGIILELVFENGSDVVFRVIVGVGVLIVSLWILEKKNQSWAWIFLSILLAPLWLPTKSHKVINLSGIYKRTVVEKTVYTNNKLKYLQETMSCTNCAFTDQQALTQGVPWCDAPQPPVIEDNYCHTWKRATSG